MSSGGLEITLVLIVLLAKIGYVALGYESHCFQLAVKEILARK